MNIVLEGPDHAGKTTLARYLAERLGESAYHYYHPGGKPDSVAAEVRFMQEQVEVLKQGNFIMDRVTAISQTVYNPDPSREHARMMSLKELYGCDVLMVYCRPSTDALMRVQDFTWRDEETEEHKQKIIQNQHTFIERYDALMAKIPKIIYNYEDEMSAIQIRENLFETLRGRKQFADWMHSISKMGVQ